MATLDELLGAIKDTSIDDLVLLFSQTRSMAAVTAQQNKINSLISERDSAVVEMGNKIAIEQAELERIKAEIAANNLIKNLSV